jgi:hypothetical protein
MEVATQPAPKIALTTANPSVVIIKRYIKSSQKPYGRLASGKNARTSNCIVFVSIFAPYAVQSARNANIFPI